MSNLVSADDPDAVKNAAEITSEYNEDTGRWIVNVDATAIPGGTLVVNSNGGDWSSTDALFEYISELTGVPLNSDGTLPNLHIEQVGQFPRRMGRGKSMELVFLGP